MPAAPGDGGAGAEGGAVLSARAEVPELRGVQAVIHGNCVEVMDRYPDGRFHAIVCDPPYGFEFMGQSWDRLGDVRQRGDATFSNGDRRHGLVRHGGTASYGADGASAGRAMQEWHGRWAAAAFRVLRPGGHVLAFGGPRTYHRLASALEDAGFEIRDSLLWLFGSGFPKSLDVSAAIDARLGLEREVVGQKHADRYPHGPGGSSFGVGGAPDGTRTAERTVETAAASDEAAAWDGWGTALKPAHEPIVVARKPLEGTVAANVLAHGVGGLNVDACRVAAPGGSPSEQRREQSRRSGKAPTNPSLADGSVRTSIVDRTSPERYMEARAGEQVGRWPANVVLSHGEGCVLVGDREVRGDGHAPAARKPTMFGALGHDGLDERYFDRELVEEWECEPGCPVAELDAQSGGSGAASPVRGTEPSPVTNGIYGDFAGRVPGVFYADRGGASRFFYTAKVSRAEREAGLDDVEPGERATPMAGRGQPGLRCRLCRRWKVSGTPCRCPEPDFEQVAFEPRPLNWSSGDQSPGTFQGEGTSRLVRNSHPTVKPIALMRWLIRLVTPPGGVVLDPFCGSGSTLCAAALEGVHAVGIEQMPLLPDDPDYAGIARARVRFWAEHGEGALEIVRRRDAGDRVRREREESGQLDIFGASMTGER